MGSQRVNGTTSSLPISVSGKNEQDSGTETNKNVSFRIKEDHENPIWVNDQEENKMNEGVHENRKSIQFYKMFTFADFTDFILMSIGTVAAIGNGLSTPLMTVLFGDLIDSYGKTAGNSHVAPEVYKVVRNFAYLGLASGVTSFLQVSCWTITGERQAARIRNLYLEALLRQDIAFFDMETNVGELVGRMSGDMILVQDAMGEKVGKFIQLVSSFLGGFAVSFIRGRFLTLVMMSIIPLLVLSSGTMSVIIGRMSCRSQRAYSEAAAVVEQTISAIRTVASFTGERKAAYRYCKHLKNAYKASVQEGLAAGIGLGSTYSFIFFGYAMGIWYGSKLIVNNGYSGGQVINVIFALFAGSFSLGQASPCISAFGAGKAAASKMLDTMKRKPLIDALNNSVIRKDNIIGNIEFKDVNFSYAARPEQLIFNGFSLKIPSGKTIALVGKSGSGKSTIISLIERFYDPQNGEVLIDGINLKHFPVRWIREKIGLVSQEPALFALSIQENIAYGKNDTTVEEIKAAIKLANASKFIEKLPQGLDTIVGDRGTQLSGGQKQRVAIARAILKDPRILLLDEATSALDEESERILQGTLDEIMTNKTTIIVAHRLTTVRNVDTITVIQQGSIVEKGSHVELTSNQDGAYSQLIRLQGTSGPVEQRASDTRGEVSVDGKQLSRQYSCFQQSITHESSPGGATYSSSMVLPSRSNEVECQENKQREANTKEQPRVQFHRLASLNKPELKIILLGVVAAVFNGVVLPIFGTYLSYIVQMFYEPQYELLKDSTHWALMYVILGSVTMVAIPARSYFFAIAGAKLIERIRSMSFNKVINMEIAWFDDIQNSSGSIGTKLSADAATIRCLVGDALALVVQNIATLLAGLLVAFGACWQLALIMLALVPLIALNGWIQLKFLKGSGAEAKMMYEDASQIANDAVRNIRTVASFSAEEKVLASYKKKCEGPIREAIKKGLISGVGFGFSFLLVFCAYAISFYAGTCLIEDKKTSVTQVFRVFFALNMVAVGISQSSSLAPDATKVKSAAASVFALLDQTSAIDPSHDFGITLPKMKGKIEFDQVSFAYPKRPQVKIFQDLCLTVQPGKTLALIGESGSGKSTAIALLQRFYNPDSGQILLDGFEIKKFQLRWLRQQMGLVNQEPVLFGDTIRANIAYGKEGDATEAEIMAAAKLGNAHTFICGLHQGYDTLVGEQGILLSGGQKQRIAIARAIVKEPRILLLDEATSALDSESERVVQDALEKVMVNRTTIVVTHRLSTIKGVDSIAVIKNGIIIEEGKHEELMKSQYGTYAALVSLQTRASSSH